jgi:hypothetical protein
VPWTAAATSRRFRRQIEKEGSGFARIASMLAEGEELGSNLLPPPTCEEKV